MWQNMCHEYEALIMKAVDHMLSKEEEDQLVAHLNQCEDCRRDYEALKQITTSLKNLEAAPLPKDFHQNLMEKVQNEAASKAIKPIRLRKQHKLWQLAGSIAACMMVGFMIYTQLDNLHIGSKGDSPQEAAVTYEMHARSQEAASEDEMLVYEMCEWEVRTEDVEDTQASIQAFLDKQKFFYTLEEGMFYIESDASKSEVLENWFKQQSTFKLSKVQPIQVYGEIDLKISQDS